MRKGGRVKVSCYWRRIFFSGSVVFVVWRGELEGVGGLFCGVEDKVKI